MATQFLKIDLSPNARDFEQAALEPGIALLDRTGANYRTLKKWLGRLIAEPEWRGSEVLFFVADEQGARPQDIRCEAATVSDRTSVKSLKEDMEAIKKRLQEAKPDAKEAKLHGALVQHFNASVNPAGPKQAEYHFFRYQDRGTWRLVWCWGYQRKDVAPAATTICTNPACRQLFLRRQEGTRDCPACASKVVVTPPRAKRRLWPIALALLLAFAAGGLGYMAWDRYFKDNVGPVVTAKDGLEATPGEWSGPMGSQLDYKILRHTKEGEEDVTSQAVAVSENPKVVRVERGGTRIRTRSPGKTNVVFYIGNEKTNATVVVKPAQNPASIKLDPAEVELGVGTTARLRVQGDVAGEWVDLTEFAEWQPVAGSAAACQAGHLEGLAQGEATVAVRYRASAEDPYRTAQATIKVVKETYSRLEIGIAPATFKEGSDALLAVTLHTSDGKQRSALNSSLLDLEVDAAGIAAIEGEFLHGLRAGKGKLTARFGDLTATADFTVESDPSNRFEVWPQDLPLMVGELAELQVSSSSTAPIRVTSSAPEIAAVETGLKVVGRAPGSAKLRVVQGAFEKEIDVEVTPANLKSITFSPPRMSVPVDRSVPVRLVGQTKEGEQIDLAAEAVTWVEIPQAALVELDVKKLELLGRLPTDDSPQTMVARVGDLRASGQIDVVPGPLQIELTPAGVTNLPEGQSTQLHAWAKYGGGTRTEIEPGRLEWRVLPESESSLLFDSLTATVRARKAEASLKLKASYQGYTSNEVEIRSISQDLALTLNADREIILVGDSGAFSAAAQGSPLEHSLTGATFESSDSELLSVDKSTGDYHALAAGKVKVTVRHDKAMTPAEIEVEIVSPADAQLAFRPDNIKLLVNGRQPLELVLTAGSREQSIPLTGGDDSALVAIPSPDAVQWQPPVLAGVKKQSSFEITAQHGGMTARALVEVVEGDGPIRVVPDKAQLSLGQALSPKVEQQVTGDQWQELDPALIKWNGTVAVGWTPATGGLRPQLTPREASSEPLKLTAEYDGKTAELVVTVDGAAPPRGPLAVVREPEGEDLQVDAQQRFTIVVDVDGTPVPAVDVKWQPAFENDYVRWDPPVLIAKRSGHEQRLSASVGEEKLSFTTRTVDATLAEPELALPTEKPEEVRIVADQPQPIVLPVGTRFSSFRVEAILAQDRPEINVTREALLQVVGSADAAAPIALIGGEVVCQRPGDAEISAEFNGVKAKENLRFKVVEELELASLAIEPSSVRLAVGERVTLHVQGFTGSQDNPLDVGDITALPKLTWKSDDTEIVAGDGPTLTGLSVGSAKVTVTDGKISATVDVEVLPADGTSREDLVVAPRVLRLRVGESKWLGTDVVVRRGETDVTEQAEATSASPDIVRVNPDLRFLEGVLPGRAVVDINVDGQTTSLEVEVAPATAIENGRIVIEPASGTLAVGGSLPLRVLLVGEDGQSVDRTGSAVLTSSDDQRLSVAGSKITGIAAGEATITATLLGAAEAQAAFSVVAEKFTALHVVPSTLRLAVGERKSLRIEAVGPAGRRQLSDHPDLSITFSSGEGVADLLGREVRGVAPGEATLQVSWQGLQASPVSVVVTDDPITGLRIEPLAARIVVGDEEAFRVYVRRGNGEHLVTAADNLQISVSDTSVATVNGDQSVRGLRIGSTPVTARLGSQRATAQLTVVRGGSVSRGSSLNGRRPRLPRGGGDPANQLPPGLQFIPDVLTLQLGVPGAPVRLVNVGRNGAVEDVIGQATLNVQPAEGNNVVEVQRTALGPVFLAKKVGEAQVFGRVGNRTTRDPLRVVVVDPSQPPPGSRPAHLIVQPDPLRLNVAASGRFGRVQYVPPGGTPSDIAFTVTSQDEQIVTVEKDGTLHGMAPGRALVTVRAVDPSLADLKSDVAVFVDPPAPLSPAGTRLVLSGPRQVMLGAPAQFHVELADGAGGQDVTSDGAELVLDTDQRASGEVQAGGILVPKKSGQLAVRARYKDLISNVVTVQVDSAARDFASLEIELDRRPLVIDERRPYRLWGNPTGGGPRQDLTHLVNQEGDASPEVEVEGADGAADIAEHVPSALIGRKPGQFAVQAKLGSAVSEAVRLEVVAAPLSDVVLTAEPASVTIAVGERTPPLRILARAAGERDARAVNAAWSSVSNAIAEPDPATPGVFIGKSAGRTRLEASFSGQTVGVDVTVTGGNVFESVAIQDGSLSFLPDNHFSVSATIQYTSDIPLEYRIVTVGGSGASPWVAAPAGAAQKTTLVSPPIRMGQGAPRYNLIIEARDEQQRVIERFPHSFRLKVD